MVRDQAERRSYHCPVAPPAGVPLPSQDLAVTQLICPQLRHRLAPCFRPALLTSLYRWSITFAANPTRLLVTGPHVTRSSTATGVILGDSRFCWHLRARFRALWIRGGTGTMGRLVRVRTPETWQGVMPPAGAAAGSGRFPITARASDPGGPWPLTTPSGRRGSMPGSVLIHDQRVEGVSPSALAKLVYPVDATTPMDTVLTNVGVWSDRSNGLSFLAILAHGVEDKMLQCGGYGIALGKDRIKPDNVQLWAK